MPGFLTLKRKPQMNTSFEVNQTAPLAVTVVVLVVQTRTLLLRPTTYVYTEAQAVLERGGAAPSRVANARLSYAIKDFRYDGYQEKFWCLPESGLRGADMVDAFVPMHNWKEGFDANNKHRLLRPSAFLKRIENDLVVENSTWWPGQPELIMDMTVITSEGVIRPSKGARLYNTYVPPPNIPDDSSVTAERWVDHVRRVFPDPIEHNYFFDYLAHAIQRPDEKCNTAIVMAGVQKVGKDTALEPLRFGLGTWNVQEIGPDVLDGPFNGYRQAIALIINEIRPKHSEFHASSFYNGLKPLIAAPPHWLQVNEKFVKTRVIINLLRVIMTTNDWLAMHIPRDDRRMFVMLSPLVKDWQIAEHGPTYFADLWRWMEEEGGVQAAVRWLALRDLSHFDPKAEAPKTEGWEQIVEGNATSGDVIAMAVDVLTDRHRAATKDDGRPTVILSQQLSDLAKSWNDERGTDLKNALKSKVPLYRMAELGYDLVPHPAAAKGGRWRSGKDGRSRVAFVLRDSGLRGDAARQAVLNFCRAWVDVF